jgi:membrane-associated phospholipid phosphatase
MLAGAGLACLAASVLTGLAVRRGGTWLDHAVASAAGRLLPPHGALVRTLGGEAYWPHGAYLTALLPVAITVAVLVWEARHRGLGPMVDRWRWVLATLLAIPMHYSIRVVLDRPGPGEGAEQGAAFGAYPSGTALAVGLGWGLCLVVVGGLRPRWRPQLVVITLVALVVHAAVRTVSNKHWATDILGAYLLDAGVFLLASLARPSWRRPKIDRSLIDAR